jgi:NAD(P)-dependent dehydrogenase (short-subunit alcohol dehydrogenase family)
VIARSCQILGLSPRFTSVASRADKLSRILASAPVPYDYEILPIYLSSISSIRAVAASLNKHVASGEISPIRALILNAVVLEAEQGSLTSDGLQTLFTVNYLANLLLVLLVLDSMDKEVGRILMISTPAHDSENWMSRLVFPKDN